MFDFHLHSTVSFDGSGAPQQMADAAARAGLKEICFTDHVDYSSDPTVAPRLFTVEEYNAAYGSVQAKGLTVRHGFEFGLTRWNQPHLAALLAQRPFDFVIGSLHFVDGFDPYDLDFWNGKTPKQAFTRCFDETLECVRRHRDFDVLGHLTYVCKSEHNPTHEAALYRDYREVSDEIMKVLIANGKGMEINTSGIDRCNAFLPSADYLRRFKELGGEIVTVGSDAHAPGRVGQYTAEALELLRDIFGYVCTFADRKPVFHKL